MQTNKAEPFGGAALKLIRLMNIGQVFRYPSHLVIGILLANNPRVVV